MSRDGLGRNDLCFCASGKKYKKCCYPRTRPDFSKPNAGLPSAFEEREAICRALTRLEAQRPHYENMTIGNVDVGRARLMCAQLPPYADGVALPGTLAPPTPLQVETKYKEIRDSNPYGVTEVVVTYTYPEMFGFAEARMVFDPDEVFPLVDGRLVSVLDLFRGMQVVMSDGTIGTISGTPERRYEIPVPPLPGHNGLWTSRVVGQVKHTAHEIVEFRWGGQMVRVTPGHAVWSADRRGWVGAHELLPGEMIRVAGNMVAPVEAMKRVPGQIEVFGIEVEYFHNYFVGTGDNAMLVHNGPQCLVRPAEVEGEFHVVDPRGKVLGRFYDKSAAEAFAARVGQLPDNPTGHARVIGKDIALGFGSADGQLGDFAGGVRGVPWWKWKQARLTETNPRATQVFEQAFTESAGNARHIHFNLEGFDIPTAMQSPNVWTAHGRNMTNMEFKTILANEHLLQRTTFYGDDGSIYRGAEIRALLPR